MNLHEIPVEFQAVRFGHQILQLLTEIRLETDVVFQNQGALQLAFHDLAGEQIANFVENILLKWFIK